MTASPQAKAALERANEIRLQRAQLKRDIAAKRVSFNEVLLDPPDYLARASIGEIMRAVPRMGKTSVGHALNRNGLTWTRTFIGTSIGQRQRLDRWLRDHHPANFPGIE